MAFALAGRVTCKCVRVDLREGKAERPLLSIKGMRCVAELDELELLDHVGIVDRDRKGLALLQRFRGAR